MSWLACQRASRRIEAMRPAVSAPFLSVDSVLRGSSCGIAEDARKYYAVLWGDCVSRRNLVIIPREGGCRLGDVGYRGTLGGTTRSDQIGSFDSCCGPWKGEHDEKRADLQIIFGRTLFESDRRRSEIPDFGNWKAGLTCPDLTGLDFAADSCGRYTPYESRRHLTYNFLIDA